MPYIGKEPVAGNFVLLDSITTSATATYALTKDSVAYSPESARNMIVSLNGVTQAPEAAFTVSGSNITFSSALTSSDVIDYILVLGDVLSVGTPSDGTVGTSQMSYPLGNFSSTGIDDNATSTAITIDSSENVGIGETTPSATLTKATITTGLVAEGTVPGFCIQDTSGADNAGYWFQENGTMVFQNYGSGNTIFRTGSGGTETIRIDSSGATTLYGKTTIATAGVALNAAVHTGFGIKSSTPRLTMEPTADGQSTRIQFANTAGTMWGSIFAYNDTELIQYSATTHTWKTSSTERMRIDSSGNFLVGTTNANPTSSGVNDPGVELSNTGGVRSTVASNAAATFNRKTDDGAIALFRKDGTTVGSIGVYSLDRLYIADQSNGLQFDQTVIRPCDNTGANTDNVITLGSSGSRFKDLYLSGGAYLGGTGAANYLDDYEEGTHNTTISVDGGSATFSNIALAYTKIGRLVSVAGTFRVDTISSPTGSLTFTLPFTSISGSGELQTGGSVVPNLIANANCNELLPQVAENASACTIFNASGNNLADAANTLAANATYRINLVYYTS